ncbi:MAG: cytochrome c peroxidase [Gemmatimonadota bacterium]
MNRLPYVAAACIIVAAGCDRREPIDPPDGLPLAVVDADFYEDGAPSEAKVELGRLLFFDKILGGNKNIACSTCHHPSLATSDGLPLGFGEGPQGLGEARRPGADDPATAVHERIPRNSPALFNLGAREFSVLFHDGRVEADPEGFYEGGFITPAKWKLPTGLETVLAAQAMFPVGSPTEMAGQKGENPIAEAKSLNNMSGSGGVWERLAGRLAEIPEYVERFGAAFPEQIGGAEDIRYTHAANAIAAFEAVAFRSDDSPFDRYVRGDRTALSAAEGRGMHLFYGRAGCAECHSGKFQTDHEFHAIAMPQIGPGKSDGTDADFWRKTGERAFVEDFGRGRVTVRPEDGFKFRTPSLRNVELTGPWGHAGTYVSLEAVVRHHLDPIASLDAYALEEGLLPEIPAALELTMEGSNLRQDFLSERRLGRFLEKDMWIASNEPLRARIAAANELEPMQLTDDEVEDLLAFLRALTDPSARQITDEVPETVPSRLRVD